jgi:lipopolysaccharide transport system ATP-binding protein
MPPATVISVEQLGKRYQLGPRPQYRTLRDVVVEALTAPLKTARRRTGSPIEAAPDQPDHIWALRNVCLEVRQGELVGIIGLNGSGKSTLLKILARIVEPTEGEGFVRGRIGSLLEVGTGFHRELTGRENVFLSGAVLGMRRAEIARKFDEIVAFSELAPFIDTPVKHYSSGMYIRLAFAVAAHLEPEILLVDEVLAVGDMAFQAKCLGRMREVTQEGRTILFVSHDLRAISGLTHRCILLQNGEVAADGPTGEIVERYVSGLERYPEAAGVAELATRPRSDRQLAAPGRLEWVRILDAAGRQSGIILEGQNLTVEVGFALERSFRTLQLGCVFTQVGGGGKLFTVPSPEFQVPPRPGRYLSRLTLSPCPLRKGTYTIGLRFFGDGQLRDKLNDAIQIMIQPFLAPGDNPAYAQPWVGGVLRVDGKWSEIVEADQAMTRKWTLPDCRPVP